MLNLEDCVTKTQNRGRRFSIFGFLMGEILAQLGAERSITLFGW